MENLTLEALPKAFVLLTNEVSQIKKLLLEKSSHQTIESDQWFNLNELCLYHPDKPKKATVYSWVSSRTIPFHKNGKKLRFNKEEIDRWLSSGRVNTISEVDAKVDSFLSTKKGGKLC